MGKEKGEIRETGRRESKEQLVGERQEKRSEKKRKEDREKVIRPDCSSTQCCKRC